MHSMIKVKDQCMFIDEMTNLMSGNHICTIDEPSATMLIPHLGFLRIIPCVPERLTKVGSLLLVF